MSSKQDDIFNTYSRCYTFIQSIKDFPRLILNHQVGHRYEFFQNQLVSIIGEQQCNLTLVLYPGGYDDDHSDYVAFRALITTQPILPSSSSCKNIAIDVAICDRNDEERCRRRIILTNHHDNDDHYERLVVKNFVSKCLLLNSNELLISDQLKIICRVFVGIEVAYDSSGKPKILHECRHAQLDNYEKLLDNGDFSDFELKVGEVIFKVHKCILAAHSPVFAAMFHNDMSEKKKASTDIEDVDVEQMRELLRFLYVGKVEKLDELACGLWIVADKYDVKRLKEVCEKKLIEMLSVDNISENLCFIDKYNACKLKIAAIRLIIDNVVIISDDEKFKSNIKTLSSDLLSEILMVMCDSLKRSIIAIRDSV